MHLGNPPMIVDSILEQRQASRCTERGEDAVWVPIGIWMLEMEIQMDLRD